MPTAALADPFLELSTPAGVPVHLHRTTAFKTVLLQWVAECPLDDGVPARALLPDLLTRATRRLPSLSAVAARCEELYATELLSGEGRFRWLHARPGASDDQVRLRAERDPAGDGRVYRIAFTVSDGRDDCSGVATVEVRRHKHRPAIDSAPPSYDSFG